MAVCQGVLCEISQGILKKFSEQIYCKVSQLELNFRKLPICNSADNNLPRRYFPGRYFPLEHLQAVIFLATNDIANTLFTKKGNKQILNNHGPVSHLPTCGKHLEEIIFDRIFQHLMENNLLNPNQSSFMLGDSCIHQLISITHQIYDSFASNNSLEARGVF